MRRKPWPVLAAAASALHLLSAPPAQAFDNGQFGDVPDNVRAWFKNVRSPNGIQCCDLADGHRTDYDIRADRYWIPNPAIPGEWIAVPPEAVVHNAGNPVGEAVVWYAILNASGRPDVYVRCFVPGDGV
jgi:hypothetical protein